MGVFITTSDEGRLGKRTSPGGARCVVAGVNHRGISIPVTPLLTPLPDLCNPIRNNSDLPIMIHQDLQDAINSQINQELTAAYNYLGMAIYFDDANLEGFAHWMQMQHQEEQAHAMRLLKYLQDRGGKVVLESIASPRSEFSTPLEAFEVSLKQEQQNTKSINELYALASTHKDYATRSHLQWFIDEQVEEEKSCEDIIALLERIGDDTAGLLYLNDKLLERQAETVPGVDQG